MIAKRGYGKDRSQSEILRSLSCYWPENVHPVHEQTLVRVERRPETCDQPRMVMVNLPNLATWTGVEGTLLVQQCCIAQGDTSMWRRTDWLRAIAWSMDGEAKRRHKRYLGPIHSYSHTLRCWDDRLWERAWVKRIAIFLRSWEARFKGRDADSLLGPMLIARIHLNNDMDAVRKILSIRIKQGAFQFANSTRMMRRGHASRAFDRLQVAGRFLLGSSNYNRLSPVASLEEQYGVRSRFFVYGGCGGGLRRPDRILFDPSYSLGEYKVAKDLRELSSRGLEMDLHQSFRAGQLQISSR